MSSISETGIDWEAIGKDLETADVQWDFDSQTLIKSTCIGSLYSLTPSGKMYMPFAFSNLEICPACLRVMYPPCPYSHDRIPFPPMDWPQKIRTILWPIWKRIRMEYEESCIPPDEWAMKPIKRFFYRPYKKLWVELDDAFVRSCKGFKGWILHRLYSRLPNPLDNIPEGTSSYLWEKDYHCEACQDAQWQAALESETEDKPFYVTTFDDNYFAVRQVTYAELDGFITCDCMHEMIAINYSEDLRHDGTVESSTVEFRCPNCGKAGTIDFTEERGSNNLETADDWWTPQEETE